MKRSLPPRRGDAEVLGSAWATTPSDRRPGALLECLHEPCLVRPFRAGMGGVGGPTRGVAPGWRVSRRWRSRVMAGLAGLGPRRGSVGGWLGRIPWLKSCANVGDVFPHSSASLRLGGRLRWKPEDPNPRIRTTEALDPQAGERRQAACQHAILADAHGPRLEHPRACLLRLFVSS